MVGRQMDDSLCLFYLKPVRLFMSHPVKRASTGLSECQRGGTLLLWHLIVNARTFQDSLKTMIFFGLY